MTERYEFRYVDPHAPNGYRDLTLAGDIHTETSNGMVVAYNDAGKVRAAAPEDDFVHLDKLDDDIPDGSEWVDVRHQHDDE